MKTFTLIDIETTGLSANSCEITEIGAIKVNSETLEIVDKFECLIDIKAWTVPPFITRLTGITKTMLVNEGLPIEMALNKLKVFCKDDLMFAHNASFDKRFIRHYLSQSQINFIETEWVDTIKIFKKQWPGRKTYKLESLIQDFNLASKEDHRAISDALYTLELLKKCK